MSDPETPDNAGDTAPATAPADRNSQPSLLNIKTIETNTLMRVESDILEPLTFSQSECVFELQPKGFLHPGSSITLAFDVNDTIDRAFPFVNTGIHSLIRRAVLRTTAGRVINDTDDFNHLQSIRSMFVSPSVIKEREQYKSGKVLNFGVGYNEKSDVTSQYGLVIDNGMEQNVITGDDQGVLSKPYILNKQEPEFSIKLHDLFNYCRAGNQLPLFLLPNERVQIVLYFTDQASRLSLGQGDQGHAGVDIPLTQSLVKFVADYTFYDGEIMDKLRSKYETGLTFSYTDYRLSKQSLSVANAVNNVRNIGGQGTIVKGVLMGCQNQDGDGDGTGLLGPFSNEVPDALGGAGNRARYDMELNLFINSEYLYPQNVTNPARQFHNLKEAEGMVPYVANAMYSAQQDETVMTDQAWYEFEAQGLSEGLGGLFFAHGFRTSGLASRIDNRGIDLHLNTTMNGDTTQRAWLEIERYVVISDGHLECYFV